jgi:hypothetical protein
VEEVAPGRPNPSRRWLSGGQTSRRSRADGASGAPPSSSGRRFLRVETAQLALAERISRLGKRLPGLDVTVRPRRVWLSGSPPDRLLRMAGDDGPGHDERVRRRRRAHGRAATTHERAARSEREAADASEMFGDAEAAEGHREAARRQEGDADDERREADDER